MLWTTCGRALSQQWHCRLCFRVFRASWTLIVALRDQQLRIMERLDELSLGVLGQTLGEDKERPPVASSATIDHTASSVDVPQTSFDALCSDPSTSRPGCKVGARPKYVRVSESGDSAGGAAMRHAANLCFEASHPDTSMIGRQAGLCGGFPPALSSCQQPTSQAARW